MKSLMMRYQAYDEEKLNTLYDEAMETFNHKIIVLDDDPTGVQTVHDIHVYTDWSEESIIEGFQSKEQMFFILTNSRAFSSLQTKAVHEEIGARVHAISQRLNISYLLISRGDSTLRGHYPLETESLQKGLQTDVDGEILVPYFKEGGRYTIDNIHYVEIEEELVPAAETEFALDQTFAFHHSHLGEYVEEKSDGRYKKEDLIYIDLHELRQLQFEEIKGKLRAASHFNKIIVNAISEEDLKVFAIALVHTLKEGKNFLFRTAASFTKIIGHIPEKALLSREQMILEDTGADGGGLIIVGSHVKKTTQQLSELIKHEKVKAIEFKSDLVLDKQAFEKEIAAKISLLDDEIKNGQTCVIYTNRKRLDLQDASIEKQLELSVEISNGLTKTIQSLKSKPKYIIAKGGITSSEIGTSALGVKKALVLGQALPGVPVWRTDENSKYPYMPYIIFPGNVGKETDLYSLVDRLEKKE